MIKHKKQAENYGKWLKRFLKTHRITASSLSLQTKFHHNVIRNWIRGRNLASGYSMAVVATVLSSKTGIPRPELLNDMVKAMLEESV